MRRDVERRCDGRIAAVGVGDEQGIAGDDRLQRLLHGLFALPTERGVPRVLAEGGTSGAMAAPARACDPEFSPGSSRLGRRRNVLPQVLHRTARLAPRHRPGAAKCGAPLVIHAQLDRRQRGRALSGPTAPSRPPCAAPPSTHQHNTKPLVDDRIGDNSTIAPGLRDALPVRRGPRHDKLKHRDWRRAPADPTFHPSLDGG